MQKHMWTAQIYCNTRRALFVFHLRLMRLKDLCISYIEGTRDFFDSDEVESLTTVYQALYPGIAFEHIPMVHERFHELQVLLIPKHSSKYMICFL